MIGRFPFRLISDQKFTSQLKCQAYHFAVSELKRNELVLFVDADTCCFRPILFREDILRSIRSGRIGLIPDIADHHFKAPTDCWYLTHKERLTYVNSGVVLASSASLALFDRFRQLSERPEFLHGPFNDQKVINFALGKFFHDKLLLLDKSYNWIGPPFSADAAIGHCAGGAGWLGSQRRKTIHEQVCADILAGKNLNLNEPQKTMKDGHRPGTA
jgi:hypothetical protein